MHRGHGVRGHQTRGLHRLRVSGGGGINGTLAASLDPVTVASNAQLRIAATTVATLADATLVNTARIDIRGQLSATLQDATLASSATIVAGLTGALAVTLADVSLTSNGQLRIAATLSRQLDDVVVVSAATLANGAQLSAALDSVALASQGALSLTGLLSATLGDATLASTGLLTSGRIGTLVVTLGDATLAASATLTGDPAPQGDTHDGGGFIQSDRKRDERASRRVEELRREKEELVEQIRALFDPAEPEALPAEVIKELPAVKPKQFRDTTNYRALQEQVTSLYMQLNEIKEAAWQAAEVARKKRRKRIAIAMLMMD